MYLDTILPTDILKPLDVPCMYGMTTCPIVLVGLWGCISCTCTLIVLWLLLVVVCAVLIIVMFPSVVIKNFILNLVNGPGWVFTLSHCIPKVSKFLLEKLWLGAKCFCPVGKCTYDTVLGRETVMTVPLQILVSVGGFLVHCYG